MREKLIKQMPDRETLEAFVRGLEESPTVIFNLKDGKFEWVVPHKEKGLGEPKTETGWKWRGL
jgi:transcriptional regulator of NAD metabolism